ncbi:hypothetical protein ACFO3I_15265 [Rheinheimera marina]|uniref:DUF4157 domain-containing protein n=1 Tax=Rheinheimera marina TaxID=1774958 RepID=A0ABV9JQ98_9GAMM
MAKVKYVVATLLIVGAAAAFFHQRIIAWLVLPPYIEWAAATESAGVAAGEPLNAQQLQLARDIGILQPEQVRLVYVDEVPFPYHNLLLKTVGEALGFIGDGIINNAQVFGYSIYVRKDYQLTRPKLAHELVHVLQIERSDLTAVVSQHFADLARYGYDDSPLEVEAYKANSLYPEL